MKKILSKFKKEHFYAFATLVAMILFSHISAGLFAASGAAHIAVAAAGRQGKANLPVHPGHQNYNGNGDDFINYGASSPIASGAFGKNLAGERTVTFTVTSSTAMVAASQQLWLTSPVWMPYSTQTSGVTTTPSTVITTALGIAFNPNVIADGGIPNNTTTVTANTLLSASVGVGTINLWHAFYHENPVRICGMQISGTPTSGNAVNIIGGNLTYQRLDVFQNYQLFTIPMVNKTTEDTFQTGKATFSTPHLFANQYTQIGITIPLVNSATYTIALFCGELFEPSQAFTYRTSAAESYFAGKGKDANYVSGIMGK